MTEPPDADYAELRRRLAPHDLAPSDETLALLAPVARDLDAAAARLRTARPFSQLPAELLRITTPVKAPR